MQFNLIKEGGYEYIQHGKGPTLLLLHGLFGALSNWNDVLKGFTDRYRVIIPLMPIYKSSVHNPSVEGLAAFVSDFVHFQNLQDLHVVGNSLGGHIAQVFALKEPEKVRTLTLTGSSGLFESGMGQGYISRGNYEFIKERVAFTFYSPETATRELVDEVFEIVNDASRAIRIVKIARAAQRQNLRTDIQHLRQPTCLIWGLNDNITPTSMMEQPEAFNQILSDFLERNTTPTLAHAS